MNEKENKKKHIQNLLQANQDLMEVSKRQIQKLLQTNEYLIEEQMCSVCCKNCRNVVFLPCSHMMTCLECSLESEYCPICRQTIEDRRKVFFLLLNLS